MTRNRLSWTLLSSAAACLAAALTFVAATEPSHATAFTYSSSARTFYVANLLIPSAGQTADASADRPGQFEFYVINNRPDIRPNGWILDNPLAPKVVTTLINERYPNAYNLGQAITPNMPAYWQLDLDDSTTAAELQQYDLLVIHTHRFVNFNQAQRSVLRQYVDQGGTLLFDDCGGGDLGIGPPGPAYHGFSSGYGLFIDVQWWGDHGASGLGVVPIAGQRHPIITAPYFLSQDEINQLGDKNVTTYFMTSGRGVGNSSGATAPTTPPDPSMFSTVIGNSGHTYTYTAAGGGSKTDFLPYISAGDYGAGHIIISAADICDDISNPIGGDNYAGTNIPASHTEDLKIMCNILAFASDASEGEGANPRHTGSQPSEFNGALLPTWRYRPGDGLVPGATAYTAATTEPAIYANISYVTDANPSGAVLHAFDLNPSEDLDGSGNPDNGSTGVDALTNVAANQDYSHGLKYDELWSTTVKGSSSVEPALSSPTVAIVPLNTGGPPQTLVLVEGMTGNVYYTAANTTGPASPALTGWASSASTPFDGTGNAAGGGTGFSNKFPPAPTVYRGRIYAVMPNKTLAVIDPVHPIAGSSPADVTGHYFTIPLPSNASGIAYSPTVASIPSQDGVFRGNDVVVTVATSGGVSSFLLGSRDEQLSRESVSATTTYQTKSMRIGASNNWIAEAIAGPEDRGTGINQWVYWLDPTLNYSATFPPGVNSANFTSYTENVPAMADTGTVGTQGFTLTPGASNAVGGTPADTDPKYADYDLIPSPSTATTITPAPSRAAIDARVMNVGSSQLAQGAAVVTPDNLTIFTANTGSSPASGYIAAVNDQNTQPLSAGSSMKWRFALVGGNPNGATPKVPVIDADGISYSFAGYQFYGPPVAGPAGVVYALAYGPSIVNPNSGLNDTIVMCFNTSPLIHASVTAISGPFQNGIIQQLDETNYLGTGLPTTVPSNLTKLAPFEYNLNTQTGYLQINDFNGNPTPRNGVITADVGFPMPVFVSILQDTAVSGTPQMVNLSSSNQGQPLLTWWAPITGTVPTGVMRKLGTWLYFGAQTTGGTTSGYKIISINAKPVEDGLAVDGGTRMVAAYTNTKFLRSFTSDVGAVTSPLVASGRYAVVQGSGSASQSGIEGFGNLYTLIADNNRLVEFDASGDVDWTCDSTVGKQFLGGDLPVDTEDLPTGTTPSPTATAILTTSKVALNRPSTIAQITPNDYLVADSGNNRCVRFDRSGRVIWELTNFLDPNSILGPGQSLTLRKPGSVIVWATKGTDTSGNAYSAYHYLVADTGNYRVLEILDIVESGQNGTLDAAGVFTKSASATHTLVWASHTADQQGRAYSYIGAQRYFAPDGNVYIMAAVANKRIAPVLEIAPTSTVSAYFTLQPPSYDTQGSSLVCLYFTASTTGDTYHPATLSDAPSTAKSGQIVYEYLSSGKLMPFPVITGKTFDSRSGANKSSPLPSPLPLPTPLRSVRFMVDYFKFSPTVTNQAQRTLVCDDDGVFDALPTLVWVNKPPAESVYPPYTNPSPAIGDVPRQYTWSLYAIGEEAPTGGTASDPYAFQFLQADFDTVTKNDPNSQKLFVDTAYQPSSALLLSNGDYLITNQGAAGDSSSPDHARVGGSVIEIDPANVATPVGRIYGIPTNSGAIIQPSFALRPL